MIWSEYMSLLLKYSKGHVIILSNGIKFSDTIYKVLKKGNAELIISIDSGTPEMYRRIKRVNEFDNVILFQIENVKVRLEGLTFCWDKKIRTSTASAKNLSATITPYLNSGCKDTKYILESHPERDPVIGLHPLPAGGGLFEYFLSVGV